MKIKTIKKVLISIGFPDNADGTEYAAYTIKAINECHGKIVMNKIYENVAKKFGIPWERVRRSIQHYLDKCTETCEERDILSKYVGNTYEGAKKKLIHMQTVLREEENEDSKN